MKKKGTVRLKTLLIIPFTVLIIIIAGIIGILSFLNGQQAVNNVADQLQNEVLKRIEDHLSAFLNLPCQINAFNAVSIQKGELDAKDAQALERHFWNQVKIFRSVSSIYFGNNQGGLVDSGREKNSDTQYIIVTDEFKSGPFKKITTDAFGNRRQLLQEVPDFDARTRQWYKGAVKSDSQFWSPVYILFTGQDLAIASSRPVYDGKGGLLGVVSIDLFLSHISAFLENLSIGRTGQAFIMENSGLLIASSTGTNLFTVVTQGSKRKRIKAVESQSPLIRHASLALEDRIKDLARITEKQKFVFTANHQRYFLQVTPIERNGLRWLISVIIPEKDFMGEIKKGNLLTGGLIVLSVIIVLFACIYLAQRITNAILPLTVAAKELAQGKWESRISNNSKIFEVHTLINSFNQMADQLQKSLDDLNIEVMEHKRTEEKLKAHEEQLDSILQANPDPVVVYDTNGFPQFINTSFTKVFGWSPQEIQSREIPFNPDEEIKLTSSWVKDVCNRGEALQFFTKRLTKSNEVLDISVNTAVCKDKQGDKTGLIVNFTDITEQIKIQDQLRQAQKMESVGRLAGGVAHDFNNMLYVILGNSELLAADPNLSESAIVNLTEIQEAAKKSSVLTRQLLAFARKQTVSPKIVDLNKTIGGVLTMLQRLIGEDIKLVWQPKADLWPVKIDPSQIDQILVNLCVNARDSIDGNGQVVIQTGNVHPSREYCRNHPDFIPRDYARITISDTGRGMEKQVLDNLFEPFFTTKKIGEGTGLGLATVYGIVKQNKGAINVSSDVNLGTTFTISLPRCYEQLENNDPETDRTKPQKGTGTILLVEDEKAVLDMAKTMLERLGYHVLATDSPDQAIYLSNSPETQIDLLMTDVVMPSMNGRDLSRIILKNCPTIKCLFMSGHTSDVIAHKGLLDEGLNFISKPFSSLELSDRLKELLNEG